ncbi:MAG: low molecular weight phosphatase family protein [Bryobacteraceae bacterium]
MKKVLFLCIGNSCRSQMAEGFARKYGADVMEPGSAGLAPASIVQSLTKKVMEAKNIRLDGQFPKDLAAIDTRGIDLVVNMSGARISGRFPAEIREWKVDDPIGCDEDVYVAVRDEIEMLVMRLILELRRDVRKSQTPAPIAPRRSLSTAGSNRLSKK